MLFAVIDLLVAVKFQLHGEFGTVEIVGIAAGLKFSDEEGWIA